MDNPIEGLLQDLVGNDRFYEEVEARLEDANEIEDMGYTLLHIAALSLENNSRIVKLLLERGADVNSTTMYGHTPLHFAVASRKREAVVAFIEAGAPVNSKDYFGRTPLYYAIGAEWWYPPIPALDIACDIWIIKRLLCYPETDLNLIDSVGCTPLMWAVKRRESDAVKELLKKGADPNIPNMNDRTPLHKALSPRNPSLRIVYALLENGAGIYCEDKFEQTPIDILVRNIRSSEIFLFAKHVIWLIALRYRIRKSLQRKLKEIPALSEHLEKCCREVRLMNSQIIYDKFTLHDFALNCFQSRFFDNERDISTPVIKLLLSGSYVEYLNYLMERM